MYYPDTATYNKDSGGGYVDGVFVPPTTQQVTLVGRYDTNVQRFRQITTGGDVTIPTFVFYMPKGQGSIPLGVELTVNDASSGMTYKGKVQQFNEGDFNAYVLCQ